MNLQQEFAKAKELCDIDESEYTPLLEKFEELKTVIESNFRHKEEQRRSFRRTKIVDVPALTVNLIDKIYYENEKYLFVRIGGVGYVMGLGKIGDLKDRVYFYHGATTKKHKSNLIHIEIIGCLSRDYYTENVLTCVQLFSHLIKYNKKYLVK